MAKDYLPITHSPISPSTTTLQFLALQSRFSKRLLLFILGCISFFSLSWYYTPFTDGNIGPISAVDLLRLEELIYPFRRGYNQSLTEQDFHMTLKYETLPEYYNYIATSFERLFIPTHSIPSSEILSSTLSYLTHYPSLTHPKPLTRRIHSTGKSLEFPQERIWFQTWLDLNEERDGWDTDYWGDEEIKEFLYKGFRTTSGAKARLLEGYELLPRGVLRGDFARYLKLYLDGGIYSDSDTAGVRPILDWPGLFPAHFHEALTLPNISSLHSYNSTSPSESNSPSIFIAIEAEEVGEELALDTNPDKVSRGLQIVQYCMLAKKHHPIMLDAMNQIIETTYKVVVMGEMDDPGALEWSGPALFTDVVFRYLLVRYGVEPSQLLGIDKPTRVGDVLIAPEGTFLAQQAIGYQGDLKLVWHEQLGAKPGGWKAEEGWWDGMRPVGHA